MKRAAKRGLAALFAAGCAWGSAHAQPKATYEERYASLCAACHGAQGRSAMGLTPSLAGQHSFYAITQLFLFRAGRRDNPAMSAIAAGMTDDDLRGFSDAIAKLPPVVLEVAGDAPRMARGQQLAQAHRCGSCHGADYAGGAQVPRLAQQREDYLNLALKGFRAGTRLGYTPAMNEALSGLKAEELDDLAHYLAHFTAPRAEAK